jgi:hypothetical protein
MMRKFGIVMGLSPGGLIGDLVSDIDCIKPSWQHTA